MLLCVTIALADTGTDTGTPVDGAPPVADAGLGLLAYVGDTVSLNGHASSDPEGAQVSYAWTQVGGPEVTLEKASTADPQFTIEAAGTLRFELIVNDGTQDSEGDTVEIVVAQRSFGGEAEGCSTPVYPSAIVAFSAAALLAHRRR